MYTKAYGAWFRAGVDTWMLGAEASAVIGLRMAKLAAGGSAGMAEAQLMLSEKVKAGLELQASLISQFDPHAIIRHAKGAAPLSIQGCREQAAAVPLKVRQVG